MRPEFRAKTLVVEIDEASWAALRAEAEARSSNLRKVTLAEIVRGLVADHLSANANIIGATP